MTKQNRTRSTPKKNDGSRHKAADQRQEPAKHAAVAAPAATTKQAQPSQQAQPKPKPRIVGPELAPNSPAALAAGAMPVPNPGGATSRQLNKRDAAHQPR